MKKFAQIVDNRIHYLLEVEELPPFAPYIVFIDITNLSPQPKEGWIYYDSNFIDPISLITLNDIKIEKISVIKIEANSRILDLVPEWTSQNHAEKQRNALMRSSKLLRKEQKNTITSDELIELDTLESLGNSVEATREASDSIELEINTLTTKAEVEDYDVISNPLWP